MRHSELLSRAWIVRRIKSGRRALPLLSVISTQPSWVPLRTKEDTSSPRLSRPGLPARPTQRAQTREDLPVPAQRVGVGWGLGGALGAWGWCGVGRGLGGAGRGGNSRGASGAQRPLAPDP